MADNVHVNRDRTAVVPEEGYGGKTWQISRKEAVRLGLLPDADPPAPQRRRASEPTVTTTTTTTETTGPISTSSASFTRTAKPERKPAK